MREPRPAELVLGSVQLGVSYGAANRTGKPTRAAALRLVGRAVDAGITKFDTARAYGDSEDRLGEALRTRRAVRTTTKLSPLADLAPDASRRDVRAAVDVSIEESLYALRREQIDCLLLHRAAHMTDFDGAVWERLIERLEDGTILALGVSVQSPAEALTALGCRDVSHLQLPFNLLDWRWAEAGLVERIRARPQVTIHARSVFLQGLLAADDPSIWPRIDGVDASSLIATIADIARDFDRQSAADLCVAYARGQDWIDGVVVGMETEDQLDDNLRLFLRPPLAPEDCAKIAARLPRVPAQLLNPAQWPRKA
ncbi:MAG: aldo/keto reductase [Rhizomicrobium sp.]|jgi:aryl-alcohol dehydrogenase-like predicted oxidoreductase